MLLGQPGHGLPRLARRRVQQGVLAGETRQGRFDDLRRGAAEHEAQVHLVGHGGRGGEAVGVAIVVHDGDQLHADVLADAIEDQCLDPLEGRAQLSLGLVAADADRQRRGVVEGLFVAEEHGLLAHDDALRFGAHADQADGRGLGTG